MQMIKPLSLASLTFQQWGYERSHLRTGCRQLDYAKSLRTGLLYAVANERVCMVQRRERA